MSLKALMQRNCPSMTKDNLYFTTNCSITTESE